MNRIDKPVARLIKGKRGGPKSVKSEMKKGKLQPTPQKYKVLRDCSQQLYANKTDNLEEMDKFLGTVSKDRTRKKYLKLIQVLYLNKTGSNYISMKLEEK